MIDERKKDEYVTITRYEYAALLKSDERLSRLQILGVDNWEGYDEAMEGYRRWEEGFDEEENEMT